MASSRGDKKNNWKNDKKIRSHRRKERNFKRELAPESFTEFRPPVVSVTYKNSSQNYLTGSARPNRRL